METLLSVTIAQLDATSGVNDGDIYFPTMDGDFLPAVSSGLVRTSRFTEMLIMAGQTNINTRLFTPTTIKTANGTQGFISTIYPTLKSTTRISPCTLPSWRLCSRSLSQICPLNSTTRRYLPRHPPGVSQLLCREGDGE